MQKTIDFLANTIKLVLISLMIVLPVRYFLIQPFYVSGASMEPSFYDNEYLIIDEISYRFNEPARGEIIVFKNPENTNEPFIKRVIGLPGEKIEIRKNMIKIFNGESPDGAVLSEPYISNNVNNYNLINSVVELQEDEYFVMGDNRAFSQDSRFFGPIRSKLIIGRVVFRGWPFNRVDVFGKTEY